MSYFSFIILKGNKTCVSPINKWHQAYLSEKKEKEKEKDVMAFEVVVYLLVHSS